MVESTERMHLVRKMSVSSGDNTVEQYFGPFLFTFNGYPAEPGSTGRGHR